MMSSTAGASFSTSSTRATCASASSAGTSEAPATPSSQEVIAARTPSKESRASSKVIWLPSQSSLMAATSAWKALTWFS